MNKKLRIVLMVLITAALVLAVDVPTLAVNMFSPTCATPWWLVENNSGEYQLWSVSGTREVSIDGTIVTSTCKGNIPLGEPFGKYTYLNTDDIRIILCGDPECMDHPFYIDSTKYPWLETNIIYEGKTRTSTYCSLLVEDEHPKNYGDFTFVSVFDTSSDPE